MRAASRTYVLRARAEAQEETRRRILTEAKEILFTRSFDDLTLSLVAERSGVTTQTVRNHVGSKEGLVVALTESLAEELTTARREGAPADTATAMSILAAEYETYGHAVSRLLAAGEQSAAMAAMAERGRREHHAWLETTFAERLPTDHRSRSRTLAALYAATDVGTWRLLRLDLGHSRRMTTEVMCALTDGVLTSP